jgi:hypothetical protein
MTLLTEQRVRAAAQQASTRLRKSAKDLLTEVAKTSHDSFDIFLSHSVKDADIVLGTLETLEAFGFSVYVDWVVDPEMKREYVTTKTAAVLRRRMGQCELLLYLRTENSADSTWMPWELGYFDALKGRVGILPLAKSRQDKFDGNEYLGLYPYVDVATIEGTENEILWINRGLKEYGGLREWVANPNELRKRA